jgi:recA bacterial DNA recombination protein
MAKDSAKDWAKSLREIEGAIMLDDDIDIYARGVASPSPSVNFTYGNTWLLPAGFTEIVFGPPKGGKSLLEWLKIGQMHRDDPEAWAILFDIEMRARAQLTPKMRRLCGIDAKRLLIIQSNRPEKVFDTFEDQIQDRVIKQGCPIRYAIMDSLSTVRGRRGVNAGSVNTQQIGDQALTIKDGLARILETQRNANMALSIIVQVRAEMDQDEVRRNGGLATKMHASWALQHYGEYFVYVGPNRWSKGRKDLLGREMVDEGLRDLLGDGKAQQTGHKIQVTMRDSSLGPKARTGEFSWDYNRGLVNVHEEVFLLGVRRKVIEVKGSYYNIGGKKYNGTPAALRALEENPSFQAEILQELRTRELRGDYAHDDSKEAAQMEKAEASPDDDAEAAEALGD